MLDRFFDAVSSHATVLLVGVGMGIYRCVHEWPVWFNAEHVGAALPLFGMDCFFLLVDAAKIVGVVTFVALSYLANRNRCRDWLEVLPSAVAAAGVACVLVFTAVAQVPMLAWLGLLACEVGAGMLFTQWIEVCGCLPPARVIEALAISYLTRILLLPVATQCAPVTSCLLVLVLAGSGFVQTALCYRRAHVSADALPPRTAPAPGSRPGLVILLAWACVYTFAYGLGEGATNLAHSVPVSNAGYALPSLLVAVLGFRFADRFDRNMLYAVSIPLMAAGLASMEFLGASATVAQLLVSAGMCAFEMLAYTSACTQPFVDRTSSMLVGSCVRVAALLSADAATLIVRTNSVLGSPLLVALVILATIGMGFVMFSPRVTHMLECRYVHADDEGSETDVRHEAVLALADARGLSPRETTVFRLLTEGKTAAQIGEELFISAGAVRAHCSRIYGKCGVHTRKEFDHFVDGAL